MQSQSASIRRRKRSDCHGDKQGGGRNEILENSGPDLSSERPPGAASDHEGGNKQLINQGAQARQLFNIEGSSLSDDDDDELASSFASKLSCNDGDRGNQSASRQTELASGLRNLKLVEAERQQQPWPQQRRKHLHHHHHHHHHRQTSGRPAGPNETNNNNNNSIVETNGAQPAAARRSRRKRVGRQTGRHAMGHLYSCETDHDHDGDIERSDDDDDDDRDDDELDGADDNDSDGFDRLINDRIGRLQIELDGHVGGNGGGGGRFETAAAAAHLDCSNSTGYNADKSSFCPLHCVDSDDKSNSSSNLYGSSDRLTTLRPRMRAPFSSNAAKARGKLVQDGDKHDDSVGGGGGGGTCSDCDPSNCGPFQDQPAIVAKSANLSSLLSRLGGGTRNARDLDNNNNNKVCSCAHIEDRLGERPNSFSRTSSQQQRVTNNSAKCSESSGWSSVLSWFPASLQAILAPGSQAAAAAATGATSASLARRRSKSRRLSAVELRKIQSNAYYLSKYASNAPPKSVEWQEQQSAFVIGDNRAQHNKASSMPTSSTTTTNYGSQSRYQSLVSSGGGVGTSAAGAGRRLSNISGRSRQRDLARHHESNGYMRLGHSYYQKSPEPSTIQELKRILLLLVIVAICGAVLWQIYEILVEDANFLGTAKFSPSELGEFKHYAVSTDAEPCAKIGKNLLAKGGHAVDAAIGTLICMGVALPNSLGLGGGCLMTIYDNVTKSALVIDGREVAPAHATETMFAHNPITASRGPLSIGVPGELAAYEEAHKRFGRLPWAMLFEETIKMAEEGFPTVEHLSAAFRDMTHAKYITPPMRKIFLNNATGDYYREGEIMRLPQLAQTLATIRDKGVSEFYQGQLGQLFIEDLQKQDGKMTMDDLRNYKPIVKEATVIKLNNDLTVYTQPIPGSGLVLSIILRILHELGYYNNPQPKNSFEASALYYHHLAEALKFAYAQRAGLEDMPDDPGRLEKLIQKITSDEFIKRAAKQIDNSKTQPSSVYGGLEYYFQEDHGTAHTSVMDNEGNSVAITSSVNLYFGSGLISPRTGIIYNDVMDDFTSPNITNKFGLPPSKYNRIRPGKRPISSMAPSIFVDAKHNPRLAVGASGGSKITSAIATVALRNLFFNEDLKTAIDGPRIHHQFLPDKVWYEANFPSELLASLNDRGHELMLITGRSSVVMAVACNYTSAGVKQITANSDYRKGGSVDGA